MFMLTISIHSVAQSFTVVLEDMDAQASAVEALHAITSNTNGDVICLCLFPSSTHFVVF